MQTRSDSDPAPGGRRWPRIAGFVAAGLAILVLLVAAFPFGLLAAPLARTLSARSGRTVTIASAERVGWFSFTPTIRLSGVRIGQPAWAGPGAMATIDRATLAFPVLPLLVGTFRPRDIAVGGVRLNLVKLADGRENWSDGAKKDGDGDSARPALRQVRIDDAIVRLRDGKRKLALTARLASDAVGLRITGSGRLDGAPLRMAVQGAPLLAADAAAAYPFRVRVVSSNVRLAATGRMDAPLDFGHFTAGVQSDGRDLRDLDALIEAGLPASQDFRMRATVRHDGPDWRITQLAGTLGRSDLAGSLSVRKRDGRSHLDGTLRAKRFDFSDLSSDRGQARNRAQAAAIGRRLVPDTDIHLEKMARTDGRLKIAIGRVLSNGPTIFRTIDAVLTLDHRRLMVKPLSIGLVSGTLDGSILVDHRSGDPKLTIDGRLRGARIEDFVQGAKLGGPLRARILLTGTGRNVRAAVAHARGRVGFTVVDGRMDAGVAMLASGDVLKGAGRLLFGKPVLTPIRCLVGRFVAAGGTLRPQPLTIDTPELRGDATGAIMLPAETIALTITGRSKRPATLQSTAPLLVSGTLLAPKFDIGPGPARAKPKGLLTRIGGFLGSLKTRGDGPAAAPAPAADCARLAASALR